MNYFSVRSVGLLGLQGISVEVECVQSRRLPYLQIIGSAAGAAAETRERVLAAIESAGFKLPARRTTVRFRPGIHGFPLENLDLAVAIAILAAGGKVPTRRLGGVLVCGSLGLDGKIEPAGAQAAVKKLFFRPESALRGAILPLAESGWLPEAALACGGGFENLREVVGFLAGDLPGRKISAPPRAGRGGAEDLWEGTEAELRLLEIAAAGGHHALFLSSPARGAAELAAGLSRILPEASPVLSLRSSGGPSPRGYSGPPELHPAEELLLADHGVILAQSLWDRDAKAVGPLLSWMESGRVEWSRRGYAFSERLDAVVVADIPPCECGEKGYGRCACRPFDLQKYRRKVERALAAPFDLRYCAREGACRALELASVRARVSDARARMAKRQGCLNGRLGRGERDGHRRWPEKTRLLLRAIAREAGLDGGRQAALARVAQTVCDLRGAELVGEEDLLAARHYSAFA